MRALAEIRAIVQRAALGAEIALAQAENLGQVAVFLAGTGRDLAPVAEALTAPKDPIDLCWDSDQITVTAGSVALIALVVRDAFAMGVEKAVLAEEAQVPLVAAMLAQAGFGIRLVGLTIERDGDAEVPVPQGPVDVPEPLWSVFERFAAKTSAPETDASRNSGAGAGLTDND